jgi:hypothetical protein
MIKSDKELLWRPGRVFIPISAFSGIIGAAGVSVGAHTGAPVQQEISTIGLVGLLMDTDGDEINHLMQLPYDFDRDYPMYTRVHFTTGSATAADTIAWLVRFLAITPNVTTLISPATAQATDVASMTVTGTAYSYQTTSWGKINGGVFTKANESVAWEVELDTFAVGLTEDKLLLGLELMYTPKRLQGVDGMAQPAKATQTMLGKSYAAS